MRRRHLLRCKYSLSPSPIKEKNKCRDADSFDFLKNFSPFRNDGSPRLQHHPFAHLQARDKTEHIQDTCICMYMYICMYCTKSPSLAANYWPSAPDLGGYPKLWVSWGQLYISKIYCLTSCRQGKWHCELSTVYQTIFIYLLTSELLARDVLVSE